MKIIQDSKFQMRGFTKFLFWTWMISGTFSALRGIVLGDRLMVVYGLICLVLSLQIEMRARLGLK